jgi:hypothetical protein
MTERSLARELAEAISSGEVVPGSGWVAAVSAALAAALVAKAAKRSEGWSESAGARAQAIELRDRLLALAEQDALAYETALTSLERQPPDRDVLLGPDARDRGADVERARGVEEPIHLCLFGQIGADGEPAAELLDQRLRPLAPVVVVNDDLAPLRREGARAGRADPARRARDEDALPLESGLHE